jgi:hypothetical protein
MWVIQEFREINYGNYKPVAKEGWIILEAGGEDCSVLG